MDTSSRLQPSVDPATLYMDPEASSGPAHLEPIVGGRYELIRPLGEGGFSWVFLARHAQIPSLRVAIKILKTNDGHDPRAMLRLEREAEMTAMLQGRNTVKVLDLGVTEGGHPYLAMEFVRGIPVRYLLTKHGPLGTLTVAYLAKDILDSLVEAHSQGLVHRDLKPSNIFVLQERGQRAVACVLDFGIARFETPSSDDSATIGNALACTPHYAAPEVLKGQAEARSDLYALGLIMAEMLDGIAIVGDENTFVAATRHLSDDHHTLGVRTRNSALAPIVAIAINKSIDGRFHSAEEMRQVLITLIGKLEATGVRDSLDCLSLIEDYNEGVDVSRPLSSPISLRTGAAKRAYAYHTQATHPSAGRPFDPISERHFEKTQEAAHLAELHAALERSKFKRLLTILAFVLTLTLLFLVAGVVLLRQQQAEEAATARRAEPAGAAAVEAAHDVVVEGTINVDTTWHASTVYRLRGIVFVEDAARLTIEPGTTIIGETGAALVFTPNAMIYARGRADAPITFTSSRGAAAAAGDWGGVVLLGDAPINAARGHVEGVPADDPRGYYGGDDVTGSCGLMEYVRIAYAGYEVFANNELNGLTLAGCGEGTIIRNLHVHASLDDGVEIFGGTPDLRYIVITDPGDDGLDWDQGWNGNAQFVAIIMRNNGDNGIEADSNTENHNALPRSMPTLSNVTIIGPNDEATGDRAMVLRRGTGARFINTLVMGFPSDPIDVRDTATVAALTRGELRFDGLWLYGGPNGLRFDDESATDDDGGFDETSYFERVAGARYDEPLVDMLRSAQGVPIPQASPLMQSTAQIPEDEFFDRSARYIGAFRPGHRDTWMDGWVFDAAFTP